MIEKLNTWLVIAMIVVGLGSFVMTKKITHDGNCRAETQQNLQIRTFIAGLVKDPKTPAAIREQVTAAALVSFPLVPKGC